MQEYADRMAYTQQKTAFVPTMGFLHKGHLALVKEGFKHGDRVVVSIFVNPTQFGPNEDFESYPRNMEQDINVLEKEGVDILFTPGAGDLYTEGFQTSVQLKNLPNHLCGITRPGHFQGVATVVTKLFNIVKPDYALFGQKDFQQLAVIRRMVKDLNLDVEIIGVPTVRETDGLAMSSRNTYLSPDQRKSALSIYNSLKNSQIMLKKGVSEAKKIIEASRDIINSRPGTDIDYLIICDPETLEEIKVINRPALFAMAVKIGKTRLIDNMIIIPGKNNI